MVTHFYEDPPVRRKKVVKGVHYNIADQEAKKKRKWMINCMSISTASLYITLSY